MANLDVLRRSVVLAGIGLLQAGCSIGPIWASRYHGKVVDYRTQQPVENVEVFISPIISAGFGSRGVEATRWGTTDENGEFVLPGEFQVWFVPFAVMDDPPSVTLYHPKYGVVVESGLRRDGYGIDRFPGPGEAFQISLEDFFVDDYRKCMWSRLCDHITLEACSHLKQAIRERDPDLACAQLPVPSGHRGGESAR